MKTKFLLSIILTLIVSCLQAQDYWTRLPDFEYGKRAGLVAVSIGDKGYLGLGSGAMWYYDFWQFDPKTNSWTQMADFPDEYLLAQHKVRGRQAAVAFAIDGKAYVGSGLYDRTVYNDFYSFDPITNSWDSLSSYPGGPRYLAMAFTIGNKGYVGGGKDASCFYATHDFWEYNPENDKWTQMADIGNNTDGYINRSSAIAFSLGNKGYIGLGAKDYDTRMKDLWEFDPLIGPIGSWTKKNDFPGIQRYGASTFTIGKRVFVGTGGYYYTLNDIWEYFPETDSWLQKTSEPTEGRTQGVGFSIGNKGYLGFGQNRTDFASDIWEYCPGIDIECPPSQTLCFDNTNTYTIPEFKLLSSCDPVTITYIIKGSTNRSGNGVNASGFFNPGVNIIYWNVDDGKGHIKSCKSTITIDYPITVSIADQYAVSPGGLVNTIYIGYGPTSLSYTAEITGGTPFEHEPYQYLWSSGETSRTISVQPNTPGLYNYAFTATDKLGCSQMQSILVNVIDVRCGAQLDKVELCKTPPGNPDKTHVVCLSKDAVATQLKNGSMLSVCSSISTAESTGDNTVTIFPNPNKGSFNVMLTDLNSTWCEVRVFDYNGMTIDSKSVNISESTESIPFEISTSLKGIYYIRVSSTEGVKMYKVLIE